MLRNRGAATESIEALIDDIAIFDIAAHIGCGSSFVCAGWEAFPTLSICGLAQFTS